MNNLVNIQPKSKNFVAQTYNTNISQEGMMYALAQIKAIAGIGNNAAHYVMLEGLDHAKQCKNYRHEVKKAFKECIEEWKAYERRLLHTADNRMFGVDELPEKTRKIYGDITDREYYEYWASIGGAMFQKSYPFVTSLQNKYKVSLDTHGEKDAEHKAWVMTGASALYLAADMYSFALENTAKQYGLPAVVFERTMNLLDLARLAKMWEKATRLLSSEEYELSEQETKNIRLGIEQLRDCWTNVEDFYEANMKSVEDYSEVFRTKGEQKKALRRVAEARADIA